MREHRKRQAAAKGVEDLIERAVRVPAASLHIVEEGIRRLAAYQNRRYAALYLDRLAGASTRPIVRDVCAASRGAHVVRGRDLRGAGQDRARTPRTARAPRRAPSRYEPLDITEHFKPGNEEIAAILPPLWAAPIGCWRCLKFHFSMHVRSTTIWGFVRLRFLVEPALVAAP